MPADPFKTEKINLAGKPLKLTGKPIKLLDKINLISQLQKEDALKKRLKNVRQR